MNALVSYIKWRLKTASSIRLEFARVARPTRKGEAPLLAAQAGRLDGSGGKREHKHRWYNRYSSQQSTQNESAHIVASDTGFRVLGGVARPARGRPCRRNTLRSAG